MKQFDISHAYDIDLWNKGVYDAKSETLAQICAFLNPIRQRAETALHMEKELKLSSGYVLFFHIMNICSDFLSSGGSASDADGLFSRLFTFKDFKRIVGENGLVPLSAMPDASCHHKGEPLYVAENRLRLGIKQISQGTASKESVLEDIRRILEEGLGNPKTQFDFSYIDDSGEIASLKDISPKEFFEKYCGTEINSYTVFNADSNAVIKAAANQIKNGEQVVVCADTRHQANQMLGFLNNDVIDEKDMFGSECSVSKEDKLSLGIIKPTAYLSLDGVAFDESGKVLRFKAQDAHGSETGADGHYTMSAKWFKEYVLFAIINKKYLDI